MVMIQGSWTSRLPLLLGVTAFLVPTLAGDESGSGIGFLFAGLHYPVFRLARWLADQPGAASAKLRRLGLVSLWVLTAATGSSALLGSEHLLSALALLAALLSLVVLYALGLAGTVRVLRQRRRVRQAARVAAPPPLALPDHFRFRERRPLAGWLYRAAGIGPVYVALAFFAIVVRAADDPWPFGAPLSTAAMFAWALGTIGAIVVWLLPAFLLDLKGRRLLVPSARQALDEDRRAPVLFLRSFGEEMAKMPFEGELYEESLVEVFQRLGPVLAVGRPDFRLPDLGAARIYLANEDWQRGVLFLLEHSQIVLLQVAESEGVAWETEQVLRRTPPERLLLFFPAVESVHERPFLRWVARRWPDLALDLARRVPVTVRIQGRGRHGEFDRARPQVRQAKWRQFRERFGPLLPALLPEQIGDSVFLFFDRDGAPQLRALPPVDPGEREVDGQLLIAAALADFIGRFPAGAAQG